MIDKEMVLAVLKAIQEAGPGYETVDEIVDRLENEK